MSDCHADQCRPCRRSGVFRTVLSLLFLYVTLVFGGGTLIKTGHPVAVEVGRILHLVTFVDPLTRWADRSGHDRLAGGLGWLAGGIEIG